MRALVCGRANKMQNYSKKLRLYNTKIVIKTIIWQIDNSIYVTNAPPKRKVASGDFSFYFFTSSLFTIHFSLFTLHSSLLSPPPQSFAFLTMFRSQNVVKFFSILCMDIDLSVVLKKRIIRKITIMPGINSGL